MVFSIVHYGIFRIIPKKRHKKTMAYYDFKEMNNNADISLLQGIPANIKTIKTANGIELHGSCPFGGDADNDGFWIDFDRKPMTWRCRKQCRYNGCPGYGKAMQFIAMREHLDLNQKEDLKKVGNILAKEIGASPSLTCKVSVNNVLNNTGIILPNKPIPKTPQPPNKQWQNVVKKIIDRAATELFGNHPEAKETLDYWHSRGIDDNTLKRHKIGFIPSNKFFGYFIDSHTGLFLDRKPQENEEFIRIPEGTTIPTFLNGDLYHVKVRKLDRRAKEKAHAEDLREPEKRHNEHNYRYSFISGANNITPALFNGDKALERYPCPDIIFVEGEADALLINSIMFPYDGYQLQAVTFGSASVKPSHITFYEYFLMPERIVIACDNDDAGEKCNKWLYSEISKVRLENDTPVPVIKTIPDINGKSCKDFGDYYAKGGNIYRLISDWLPY